MTGLKVNRIPVVPGSPIPEVENKKDEVNILYPVAYSGLLLPKRYYISTAGRSSGRSWTFARELIGRALENKGRFGCFREIQKSIKQSVHKLLCDQIQILGVSKYFKIQEQSIKCLVTGADFIFRGLFKLQSAETTKSIEGIKIAWLEEGQTTSEESCEILIPTIRENDSEIWASMNTRFKTDALYKMFLADGAILPPKTIISRTTWRDNPWFPEVLKGDMETMKLISEANYNHIWEGHLKSEVGQMIKREWFETFTVEDLKKCSLKFISADTAYSTSATADYSVLQVWAASEDQLLLIDSRRGKWEYPELLENTRALIAEHDEGKIPLVSILIEKKASGQSLIQSLKNDGINVKPYDPKTSSKIARVYSVQNKIFKKNVRVPEIDYAPWVGEFLDEVCSFSEDLSHGHDDQVDAMTQAILAWIEEINK
jgi:predicted phage terminase large subunit-like protein